MTLSQQTLRSALKQSHSSRASGGKQASASDAASLEIDIGHGPLQPIYTEADAPTSELHSNDTLAENTRPSSGNGNDDAQALLQFLADVDGGFWMLADRVKQSMISCKEVGLFLKKRAQLEEEYSKGVTKLTQSFHETMDRGDGKAGSFLENSKRIIAVHEIVANNRQKFATMVNEVADELFSIHKSTEKSRKQLKESAEKQIKSLQQTELALERVRVKQESANEAWDKAMQQKDVSKTHSSNSAVDHQGIGSTTLHRSGSFSMFKKTDRSEKMAKEEESTRFKAAAAQQSYRAQLAIATAARHDYCYVQLPHLLKTMKETNDECDAAVQYHLSKYAYHFEHVMMSDATTISPLNTTDLGLRRMVEQIDNKQDLHDYVGVRAVQAHVPFDLMRYSGYSFHPTFGVDLATYLERNNTDVPPLIHTCATIIEQFGLDTIGLYRNSSNVNQLVRLRTAVDKTDIPSNLAGENGLADISTVVPVLRSEETLADMGNLTGLVKLYFCTLPDSLFTSAMYHEFMTAANTDDERMRLLSIHDLVNKLPDPNYATLKYLMGHLDKVCQNSAINKMSARSLAGVFGPTLIWTVDSGDGQLGDMYAQCKLVEVTLSNYRGIFDTEE